MGVFLSSIQVRSRSRVSTCALYFYNFFYFKIANWIPQLEVQVPFDPVSKRTEAVVEWKGEDRHASFSFQKQKGAFHVCKGAPQVILAMCPDYANIEASVTEKVNSFASRGFRTIGVAMAPSREDQIDFSNGDETKQWTFVGLIPLRDECRPKMREIIRKAFELGVTVKMITGDQTAIARETCRELDMGSVYQPFLF